MARRTLPVLMALFVTAMSGQRSATVKAGDRAPNLAWTRIVASDPDSGGPQSLSGATSVLLFLPPVSHNAETVSNWNKLVEQFAGKPVNFVWIADEVEESLAPFLKTHSVRGWLVLDPKKDSYKAYGVEGATGVLIDAQGMIAGFTFVTPNQEQIQAVLDGRAIAIQGDATEAQLDAIFEGKAVRLDSEPFRQPAPPQKPDLPPSDEVHISLSRTEGGESVTVPEYWMRRGFELRAILAEASGVSPSRVVLPAALDNGTRYDFVLVPPRELDNEAIQRQVFTATEKHFHLSITRESRSVDVYVMTAVEGKTPRPKPKEEFSGGSIAVSSKWRELALPEGTPRTRKAIQEATRKMMGSPEFREFAAAGQLTAMTALSSSVEDLCRALEDGLRRPVLDETGRTGIYDFRVNGQAQTTEQFLSMMRDQLGLLLTPTQKSIDMIVVRSAQ